MSLFYKNYFNISFNLKKCLYFQIENWKWHFRTCQLLLIISKIYKMFHFTDLRIVVIFVTDLNPKYGRKILSFRSNERANIWCKYSVQYRLINDNKSIIIDIWLKWVINLLNVILSFSLPGNNAINLNVLNLMRV